jgi:hypothetical protein
MARTRRLIREEDSSDRTKVLEAIRRNPFCFRDAVEALRSDPAFVLEALKQHQHNQEGESSDAGSILEYVPADALAVRGDRRIVELAVQRSHGGRALASATDDLKADRELVMMAIQMGPAPSFCYGRPRSAFAYASEGLRADRDLALMAVQQCGTALKYISDDTVRSDRDVVLAAVTCPVQDSSLAIHHAAEAFWGDRDVMMAAVQVNGHALAYASEELQSDRELVQAAIENNGMALEWASLLLRGDRELVELAIRISSPKVLEFASDEIRGNKEIILGALRTPYCFDGTSTCQSEILSFATVAIQNDKEVVLAAVSTTGYALRFASKELQGDQEVVWAALQNPRGIRLSHILMHANDDLKNDPELVLYAIRDDARSLLIASPKLQLDPDLVAVACEQRCFDLWNGLRYGDLKTLYTEQVMLLNKELAARKAGFPAFPLAEFDLNDIESVKTLADSWLKETLEKIFLISIIETVTGLPKEITMGRIKDFLGLREDVAVATQVKSFSVVLSLWHAGVEGSLTMEEVWSEFIGCVNEVLLETAGAVTLK